MTENPRKKIIWPTMRSSEGIRRKSEIFVKAEITYEIFIFLKSLGVEGNVETEEHATYLRLSFVSIAYACKTIIFCILSVHLELYHK